VNLFQLPFIKNYDMKSRANIKGHPLHPILVCFPIAFFTGTFILDLLQWVNDADFGRTPVYMALMGLIGGVAAAIPGLIDLIFTVPPESTAKTRGVKHGLTNSVVLLLFATALVYRLNSSTPSIMVILGLELAGEVLLFIAGWMGGTLVYRNQIGVDPRYAGAGKWKEKNAVENNGTFEIEDIADLKLNQMMLVHVSGKRIVIAKTEKGYAAFNDHCTHRGGSLAGGAIMCGTVQCPWHGSQFDVFSGAAKEGPAKEKIGVYPVKEVNGKLQVTLR
jgi:uncharacterized membrane protein/nitrite reductase/ring-hydroxylating ferredoxin subunit